MAKRISRRTLLRGTGTALALPWLEIMSPAAPAKASSQLTEPPLRMMFFYLPNGVRPDHWTPAGDGEDYAITPHLKPLESLKSEILLLENLWNAKTVGRNGHWPKVPAWLSGGYVERTSGSDLDSGGTSVDQFAAQRIGDRTLLPTIELGLDTIRTGIDTAGGGFARMYGAFISWRDPHTPVPKEIVPQLAFDRLFRTNKAPVVSSLNPNDPALLASLQRDETSVLDLVMEQVSLFGAREAPAIRCAWMSISNPCDRWSSVWLPPCGPRSGGSIKAHSRWSVRARASQPAAWTTCV